MFFGKSIKKNFKKKIPAKIITSFSELFENFIKNMLENRQILNFRAIIHEYQTLSDNKRTYKNIFLINFTPCKLTSRL
ncbi:F0F1 ATP synthase subunit delta [Kordia periserrulae]|uniref:F0F1 ATP synthase subunit delta n=1 Tax=Kordia periserrulae TaxID=701523 RepID=UPI000D3A444F